MTKTSRPRRWSFVLICWLLLLGLAEVQAGPQELQLQARLIWGTNDESRTQSGHREVDAPLRDRLRNVFKWKKYYEVGRKSFSVPPARDIKLSDECTIHVRHLGESNIEVRLLGKNRHVVTKRQTLARDESVVLAGDDKNGTAWFVVVALAERK